MASEESLLSAGDPPPVRIINPAGRSLFLLLGDHAGNLIPKRLGKLGLADSDLTRHIAWDMGVAALGRELAALLDASFIEQRYSRLVVDCNRAETSAAAVVPASDGTVIPGNAALGPGAKGQRFSEIFDPYHYAIERAISDRLDRGQAVILVSLHSFTLLLRGIERPWDIGVLHDRGAAHFAKLVLSHLQRDRAWRVGDNQPYRLDDTDYTIPRHAYPRGLPYVELEVLQDLLIGGCAEAAKVLADALLHCAPAVIATPGAQH